jgi:hypothetical protein
MATSTVISHSFVTGGLLGWPGGCRFIFGWFLLGWFFLGWFFLGRCFNGGLLRGFLCRFFLYSRFFFYRRFRRLLFHLGLGRGLSLFTTTSQQQSRDQKHCKNEQPFTSSHLFTSRWFLVNDHYITKKRRM